MFFAFALLIALATATLTIWPVWAHPTLSRRHKIFIMLLLFIVLVPLGLGLYALLGAPQLSVL